jgi:hypothetical protein
LLAPDFLGRQETDKKYLAGNKHFWGTPPLVTCLFFAPIGDQFLTRNY